MKHRIIDLQLLPSRLLRPFHTVTKYSALSMATYIPRFFHDGITVLRYLFRPNNSLVILFKFCGQVDGLICCRNVFSLYCAIKYSR